MLKYNEIAVVDDGINSAFYNNIPVIEKSIEIDINCNIVEYRNNKIECNHGTVCAAIISKYAKYAVINSVKIVNDSNKTTGKQLIKAIDWCLENDIGIVNLSLGSTDLNEKRDIQEIINKAASCGMIIIAASSNKDKITYPASFSNVIGVKTLRNEDENKSYIFNYKPVDGVDVFAPSTHKLINYFEEEETPMCNSFAAPYITAQVHIMLKKYNTRYLPLQVKYMLCEKSINYKEIEEKSILNQHLEWVSRAVIFNIGIDKTFEMQDGAYIFKVITEKNVYEDDVFQVLESIETYLNNENLKDFDTIIIKDFNSKEFNVNFFARNLSKYRKGLVYINDSCEKQKSLKMTYKDNIWFTNMYQSFNDYMKKYNSIDIPIILVLGDKGDGIPNILKLSELFKLQGYRCGLYSDISLCELYGIDFLFLKSAYYENRIKGDMIRSILNSSEMDLAILFIELNKLDKNYIKFIEKSLENDIRIIINHDENDIFTYDEEKYNIILHNKNNMISKLSHDRVYKTKDIEEVYKYIIEIYD